MFSIIGIVVVFGAIVGGYPMEHGKLAVLMQPAELVIIFGAAVGAVLIANPLPVVIKMAKMIGGVFGSNKFNKGFYLENLKVLNEVFSYARKSGMAKLESDVEDPAKSALFSNDGSYTNWELSADRANSARRIAEDNGLRAGQVKQIRGFADQQLRKPEDSIHASNRRVSVIVLYLSGPVEKKKEEAAPKKEVAEKKHGH